MLPFLLLFTLAIPLGLLRALVLTHLWTWFVIPLGAPEISVIHALGLIYLVYLSTFQYVRPVPAPDGEGRWDHEIKAMLTITAITLMGWGVGYIVHLFM